MGEPIIDYHIPRGLISPSEVLELASHLPIDNPKLEDFYDPERYHFPKEAEHYHTKKGKEFKDLCISLASEIGITREDIIADLGCGTGFLTQPLLDKNPRALYAIDPAIAMLEHLVKYIDTSRIKIIHGSIGELALSDLEPANKIYSHSVYVHLDNPEEFLAEVYNYLPEAGIYIFTVEDFSAGNVDGESLDAAEDIIWTEWETVTGNNRPKQAEEEWKSYDFEGLRRIIEEAGGKVLDFSQNEFSRDGNKRVEEMRNLGWDEKTLQIFQKHYNGKKVVDWLQYVCITTKA